MNHKKMHNKVFLGYKSRSIIRMYYGKRNYNTSLWFLSLQGSINTPLFSGSTLTMDSTLLHHIRTIDYDTDSNSY